MSFENLTEQLSKITTKPKYSSANNLTIERVDIDKERGFTSISLVDQDAKVYIGYAKRTIGADRHSENIGTHRALIDGVRRYCGVRRRNIGRKKSNAQS